MKERKGFPACGIMFVLIAGYEYWRFENPWFSLLITAVMFSFFFLNLRKKSHRIYGGLITALSLIPAYIIWQADPKQLYNLYLYPPQSGFFALFWLGMTGSFFISHFLIQNEYFKNRGNKSALVVASVLLAGAVIPFVLFHFSLSIIPFTTKFGGFYRTSGNDFILLVLFGPFIFTFQGVFDFMKSLSINFIYNTKSDLHGTVMITVVLVFFAVLIGFKPGFLWDRNNEAGQRAKLTFTKHRQRDIAIALEQYWVETGKIYPGNETFKVLSLEDFKNINIPMLNNTSWDDSSTTISYAQYFNDPYNHDKPYNDWYFPINCEGDDDCFLAWGKGYHYYTDGKKYWILIAYGPDQKLDTTIEDCRNEVDKPFSPSIELLMKKYDPSNGTVSSGDVYRTRQ